MIEFLTLGISGIFGIFLHLLALLAFSEFLIIGGIVGGTALKKQSENVQQSLKNLPQPFMFGIINHRRDSWRHYFEEAFKKCTQHLRKIVPKPSEIEPSGRQNRAWSLPRRNFLKMVNLKALKSNTQTISRPDFWAKCVKISKKSSPSPPKSSPGASKIEPGALQDTIFKRHLT